jgi:hypothetical protein
MILTFMNADVGALDIKPGEAELVLERKDYCI